MTDIAAAAREIATARLILRPPTLDDAPAIQAVFAQWEVVRYLNADNVPWPYPADGALTYLRDRVLPGLASGESIHWTIRPRVAPDQIVGMLTLRFGDGENRGFWLDPAHRGHGYMLEAANAVTDLWFGELGQKVLRVTKAVANIPSRRISEQQGMRVIETPTLRTVGGEEPAELWEITADEWHVRKAK